MPGMYVYRVTGDGQPDMFYATQELATLPACERSKMAPEATVEIQRIALPPLSKVLLSNILSGFGGWHEYTSTTVKYHNGEIVA